MAEAQLSRDQVKSYLKNLTLMEAATLVKELEEELVVSAAAPMAMAAAPGAGAAAAAPVAKAKSKFSVPTTDAPEFDVSSAPEWDPEAGTQPGKDK